MDKTFKVTCPSCGQRTKYIIGQTELEAAIENIDVRPELVGAILADLSLAIERGDRAEARLMLDRLAAELGGQAARDQVETARFSPLAHPAP